MAKKLRFLGVPHAPALVIPDAVEEGAETSVTPWKPGEIRAVSDAVAARILTDYAKAGSLGSPAFTVVEEPLVTKPDPVAVKK